MKEQAYQQYYSSEFLTEKLKQLHAGITEGSTLQRRINEIVARFEQEKAELDNLAVQAGNAMTRTFQRCTNPAASDTEKALKWLQYIERPLIEDLCGMAEVEFVPGEQFVMTVDTIVKKDREWAMNYLSSAVGATVDDDGDQFIWRSERPYAPCITFAIDEGTRLRYDSTGRVISPALAFECPFLSGELGVDFGGSAVYVLRGELDGIDGSACSASVFRPVFRVKSPSELANYVLLAVKWGGAGQKTRGQSEDEVKKMKTLTVTYFTKASSKKGGEGCDFYILPCEQPNGVNLIRSTIEAGAALEAKIAQGEYVFGQKFMAMAAIKVGDKSLQYALADCNSYLDKLTGECLDYATGRMLGAFVHVPEFAKLDTTPAKRAHLREMSLAEILRIAGGRTRSTADVENYRSLAGIQVQTWKDFVVRYAMLQPIVAKLHGWMEIYGEYVEIILPKGDGTEDAPVEMVFWFSEAQLNDCITFLQDRLASEEKFKDKNTELYEELLVKMVDNVVTPQPTDSP